MAIRYQHGSIKDVGELAQEAGKAEASQMQAQRDQQIMLQAMQNSARLQSQQMQINAQKEMTDFMAFVNQEADKRTYAWQVERDDLVRRHDFDMLQEQKQQLVDLENRKELQRIHQLDMDQQRVEDLFDEGRISEEELGAALLKMSSGYYRQIQKADPVKDQAQKIMQGESAAEVGNSPASIVDPAVDPAVESLNRTALLNMAMKSGDEKLANFANEGDYGQVLRELAKPTDKKDLDVYNIQTSYLQTIQSKLPNADRIKLRGILQAGKPDQVSKAYKEVVNMMINKSTDLSSNKIVGTPEQVVNRGYQTLAEMRRSNNEF